MLQSSTATYSQQPAEQVVGQQRMRVATWNVRSLNDRQGKAEGKVALLIHQLRASKVDICGLAEVRWPGEGHRQCEQGFSIIHSGQPSKEQHGVGFCLSPAATQSLETYLPISDRIVMARFRLKGNLRLVIIQVYAPTSTRPEEEANAFYVSLHRTIGDLMVIGDFNAQVSASERWGRCVGRFAVGRETTPNGVRMIDVCHRWGMAVKSTFFQHKVGNLYTWYSNDRWRTRSQLDHCLMTTTSRVKVMDCKANNAARGSLKRTTVCWCVSFALASPGSE